MTSRQQLLLAVPPVLIISTATVFYIASSKLDAPAAYLSGFAFYWVVWCYLVPFLVLGKKQVGKLFGPRHRFTRPVWLGVVLLVAPVISTLGGIFLPSFDKLTSTVLFFSLACALINGPGEELLWRGSFVSLFPNSWWWGVLYPSIGFGCWHIGPLLVSGGAGMGALIVIGPMLLGIAWGWIALRTGSIFWLSLAHISVNILALTGRMFTVGQMFVG